MDSRAPVIRTWLGDDEMIADNFAGGGGASTGILAALGRSPDVAINHDPEALAMHAANHPDCDHRVESVWKVDPIAAAAGRSVALAWFSPDCKHFSKAKGGKPREQRIRGLAWVAVRWAHRVQPRVIIIENVEEFLTWGPLHRQHTNGCEADGADGRCRTACRFGMPIESRKGETFRRFVAQLEAHGYAVEWRTLRACDFGAPTTRRRLFLVARCDGRAIRWPTPTHGKSGLLGLRPYRTAAECIDWSIPCPSIFDRAKPLADKTMARIARGVRKFVLEAARPFVIPVNHGGVGRRDLRVHDVDAPMPTVTGGQRGGHAIAVPYLVHRSNGERVGQAPRIYDPAAPLGTIVAQGNKHALCAAFIAKHYGERAGGFAGGQAADAPIGTTTVRDHHALVAAHLTKFYGTSTGAGLDEPMPTITAAGWKLAQVAAFLGRYNGNGDAEPVGLPLGTLTTKPRFGLVIDGEEYVVVDIGMRMLTPRELFRAQGFADDYQIDPCGPNGKPLTKTAQIRMCGNSVSPPPAEALIRINFAEERAA